MKTIDIVGKNYLGKWDEYRIASRCLIIDEDKILLSYIRKLDMYMIPGGGVEGIETIEQCCIREVEEETGKIVEISECKLEIDEYYQHDKFIDYYFVGKVIGEGIINLTENEANYDSTSCWVNINEAIKIFSSYSKYEGINEVKRGLYFREYTALTNILK